jgi:hypothetical protein
MSHPFDESAAGVRHEFGHVCGPLPTPARKWHGLCLNQCPDLAFSEIAFCFRFGYALTGRAF